MSTKETTNNKILVIIILIVKKIKSVCIIYKKEWQTLYVDHAALQRDTVVQGLTLNSALRGEEPLVGDYWFG